MSSVILLIGGIVKVDPEFCYSVKSGRDEKQKRETKKQSKTESVSSLYISNRQRKTTGCNKIIVPCTLYPKNGIFYFSNKSNRLIYMYVR